MRVFRQSVTVLFVVIMLLFAMTACTPSTSPTVTPSTTPSTSPTVDTTPDIKTDSTLSDYVIIYPEETDLGGYKLKQSAIELSARILDKAMSKCRVRSDKIDEAEGFVEYTYEILIGSTNRIQSAETKGEIKNYFDFIIKQVGTKIVILGGSEEAVIDGVNYFSENYLNEELATSNGIKLLSGLNCYGKSEFERDIVAWTFNGMDKIVDDTSHNNTRNSLYELNMAKNETETFQIGMRALSDHNEDMTIVIEGDCEGISGEAFLEYKTMAHGKMYVDALIPLNTNVFHLEKDINDIVMVRFKTDSSVAAGDYEYKIKLINNQTTETYITLTVKLHVWNFALPEVPSCTTAAGIVKESIKKHHGENADIDVLYKKYYDFLLDYNVTPYDLPYDILDERADAYMSDPRVTSFRVPYSNDDNIMIAYYNKLSTNENWLKKAYFYPADEPGSEDALNYSVYCAERVNRLCPGIKVNVPLSGLGNYDGKNAIDFFEDSYDLWCLKSYIFEYDEIERLKEMQANGDELWWYVCWEPADPYCNLLVDQLGVQHRLLFWQQAQYGATGFLYWCTNWWTFVDNVWDDISTVKDLDEYTYGDGSLLYNGNKVGVDGTCPSMRLVMVCDGIEDYELLMMAKELFGEEWMQEKISVISTSLTEYSKDSDKLEKVRIEIAEAIEKELNK